MASMCGGNEKVRKSTKNEEATLSFSFHYYYFFLSLQILYGSVAPGGAVAKITGKEGLTFSGLAKVC